MGEALKHSFPLRKVSIQNEIDFVRCFSKDLWEKPVVLFIDEFDLLFLSTSSVYSDILKTFEGIKNSDYTAIHSLVAIGHFGLLKLIDKSSPFKFTSRIRVPYFSEDQVLELFGMYSADRPFLNPLSIKDIAKHIYSKTNGHPGHTVLCGKIINDNLVSTYGGGPNQFGDLPIDLNTWKNYYSSSFWIEARRKIKVMGYLLFNKSAISPLDSQIMWTIYFLIKYSFVSTGFTIPPSILTNCEYLLEEGIICQECSSNDLQCKVHFNFTSDFVRNYMMIILRDNLSKLFPHDIISTSILYKGGYLNMYEIISTTFNRFIPKEIIRLSFTNSFKKNGFFGSMVVKRDDFIPQEYPYHFLLFEILSILLSPIYVIIPDASTFSKGENETKHRSDILITGPSNYVIEIVASHSQIGQHLEQVKTYSKKTSTPVLIIITVVNDVNNPKLWKDLPSVIVSEKEVNIIHIQHDKQVNNFNIQTNQ
ncbi:hypothetical protein DLAC_02628 [Tieghemostelium lacteum]|uniref:Uncharacterized protein n=1 Tax=Tieghemostelium lacteum TaxID=361077 RepID=A0A152A3C1_TIELA|nr:hypothetical protein DLAC_02628 [Tieghemostelium lacteum]|eukprot:KYR00605.1 hypothetical protein DLAC_02628 [Tieghemostelium lacteum]